MATTVSSPAAPRTKRVLVREEPRPAVRITARAALLLVIALIVLAFAMAPLRAYLDQRSHIVELQRRATVLQQATAHLQTRIAELHDPTELERLARECLGMVRPGETAFIVVPDKGGGPMSDCG